MLVVVGLSHTSLTDEDFLLLLVQFSPYICQIDLLSFGTYFGEDGGLDQRIETMDPAEPITALHLPVDHVRSLLLHYY